MQNSISVYSSDYVMNTQLERLKFVVYQMLYPGLYILAGSPKIGKSWFALDLCLSVANGEQFLKHDTACGQVLYLSLEDTLVRMQNRLYELTDESSENLFIAIEAGTIGKDLEEQLEQCRQKLPNLKLIVIDTLQKIREATDISYGTDYKELSSLKMLADRLQIAILLIHHTRKCRDNDPFNMISGSTGILGCVDGSMILIEDKRGSRKAKLHCTGRDIENTELHLQFEKHHWIAVDDIPEREPDNFSFIIHDLMLKEYSFHGSATELCKLLYQHFRIEYFPNRITRDLVQHTTELKSYGILFRSRRSGGCRIIELNYLVESDSSDGSLLWTEVTDPTVTQSSENVYSALIAMSDSRKHSDSN